MVLKSGVGVSAGLNSDSHKASMAAQQKKAAYNEGKSVLWLSRPREAKRENQSLPDKCPDEVKRKAKNRLWEGGASKSERGRL
ncbi:hypothetical protein HAX54_008144 [Datura stramonium]|uniref:Uncharacterized protein n=1 Tax=Datura stramonium TaxID=4076 RepID=A0ABS8RV66_DATST|nr:hypothetical protein [Datura stramonium]